MKPPDKSECFYIATMLDSVLIDFTYIHPWADQVIREMENPPYWLCQLAIEKSQDNLLNTLGSFIYGEPFEAPPPDLDKFHVGCLWLRYERRELSWATYLRQVGSHLDAADCGWDCETPYHYLNLHEDADFSLESEENTKRQYLMDHDVQPWIDLARLKFEPFRSQDRPAKANPLEM